MRRRIGTAGRVGMVALGLALGLACGESAEESSPSLESRGIRVAPEAPADLDHALVLALSIFPRDPATGKSTTTPGPATLLFLRREGGEWVHDVLQDPESNVFHKALAYTPPDGEPGLLTIAGNAARLKLWRKVDGAWTAETLWAPEFGGKRNRLRDVELADLDGDGELEIALATHDQGVVSVGRWTADGFEVSELTREANTFVHEMEIGDIDGDGALELFTTPSLPNRFDGSVQSGRVMRHRPGLEPGTPGATERFVDLGDRHAKEVLVTDLDGDGRDEAYVSVEGHVKDGIRTSDVEIWRYRTGGADDAGEPVATLDDHLCRFLVPTDVDGDGSRELLAAPFRSGLQLLRPTASGPWERSLIDADSSSFEHASAAYDLDGDGRDELYVAADDQSAVRRYVWLGDEFGREEIFLVPPELAGFTWGVTAVPAGLVR